jgi:hypothetical protein
VSVQEGSKAAREPPTQIAPKETTKATVILLLDGVSEGSREPRILPRGIEELNDLLDIAGGRREIAVERYSGRLGRAERSSPERRAAVQGAEGLQRENRPLALVAFTAVELTAPAHPEVP